MMRIVLAVHRWMGGLIGFVLALIATSGVVLLHQNLWVKPGQPSVGPIKPLSEIVASARDGSGPPDFIIFASPEFPFHRLSWANGAGRYLDSSGVTVATWETQWQRPEIWLFDFHRHLFSGKSGETAAGILALIGLGFVVTGCLLWWQRRKAFAPTLLPAKLKRPAILAHHRDLGILASPVLVLSLLTGAMLAIQPLGLLLVSAWSPQAVIAAATSPPRDAVGRLSTELSWARILKESQQQFPDAELRLVTFPRKPGDVISIRMRKSDEWLPNGRTTLWFSPADGTMLRVLDAAAVPEGGRILDKIYPLHAGKVGGPLYRFLLTISGLSLAFLGSLAVCAFWLHRFRRARR
ncbi:MAG: PepSY-associated TM helix domain-containing protein [Sphingomonadales bacterium]